MNKATFFKTCDSAAYGRLVDGGGMCDLHVETCGNPGDKYGGAWMVVIKGNFRHLSWHQLYRPPQKHRVGDYFEVMRQAKAKCDKHLVKWQRWLDEWKSQFESLPIVEWCEECCSMRKLCACSRHNRTPKTENL